MSETLSGSGLRSELCQKHYQDQDYDQNCIRNFIISGVRSNLCQEQFRIRTMSGTLSGLGLRSELCQEHYQD